MLVVVVTFHHTQHRYPSPPHPMRYPPFSFFPVATRIGGRPHPSTICIYFRRLATRDYLFFEPEFPILILPPFSFLLPTRHLFLLFLLLGNMVRLFKSLLEWDLWGVREWESWEWGGRVWGRKIPGLVILLDSNSVYWTKGPACYRDGFLSLSSSSFSFLLRRWTPLLNALPTNLIISRVNLTPTTTTITTTLTTIYVCIYRLEGRIVDSPSKYILLLF